MGGRVARNRASGLPEDADRADDADVQPAAAARSDSGGHAFDMVASGGLHASRTGSIRVIRAIRVPRRCCSDRLSCPSEYRKTAMRVLDSLPGNLYFPDPSRSAVAAGDQVVKGS